MTEESQAPASQEDAAGQGQAPDNDGTHSASGQDASGTNPQEGKDAEQQMVPISELRKIRNEAARYRTELKKLEDAKKSEFEKQQEELEALRNEKAAWTRERTRMAFKDQIALPNPRLAYGAALEAGIEVELDDEGRVKDIEKIRKRLKAENPREFGDGDADGGRSGPAQGLGGMNQLIRQSVGRG